MSHDHAGIAVLHDKTQPHPAICKDPPKGTCFYLWVLSAFANKQG